MVVSCRSWNGSIRVYGSVRSAYRGEYAVVSYYGNAAWEGLNLSNIRRTLHHKEGELSTGFWMEDFWCDTNSGQDSRSDQALAPALELRAPSARWHRNHPWVRLEITFHHLQTKRVEST